MLLTGADFVDVILHPGRVQNSGVPTKSLVATYRTSVTRTSTTEITKLTIILHE